MIFKYNLKSTQKETVITGTWRDGELGCLLGFFLLTNFGF